MELQIQLKTFEEIQAFVKACSKFPDNVDVCSGRYVINGKSLMGLLSLDYAQEVYVKIHKDFASDEDIKTLLRSLRPYNNV